MPISMPTTWVVTTCSGIGEEDPDIISALSHRRRSSAHAAEPTGTRFNGEDRPVRTSENSSRIGSPPSACQGLQQAQWSLPVLMDGEQSIQGGHWLFQTRRMLRQRLSRCFHQYSRLQLPQMPSPIYQLVYELRKKIHPIELVLLWKPMYVHIVSSTL